MEIHFCDRCHESIPDPDFENGKAVRLGDRALHVACALRGAVPGPGRTAAVVISLLALAGASYAAVRASMNVAPAAPPPSTDWRDADAALQARLEGDVKEAFAKTQAAISDAAKEIQAKSDRATSALDGRIAQASDATERRFRANEDRLQELRDFVRDVRDRASVATAVPPAAPVPEKPPAPPPSETVVQPDKPPTPPSEASPTPSPAPLDPEVEKRRDAEVSRWIERLRDRENGISFSATVQLGHLRSLRAVPALVNTLKTHGDFYTRLGAATALGELKAVDAVPALIDALDDKDDLVQTAANEALTLITGQDFKFVAGIPKKERKKIREDWERWWKENETALRTRLNQPSKAG